MTDLTLSLVGALGAGLSVTVLVPWAVRLAPRIGALDVPRDGRRMHTRPTPRTGGLAMFVGLLVGMSVSGMATAHLSALVCGATLLVLLGVLDDVFRLPPALKLIVQIIAAATALGNGGAWERLPSPGGVMLLPRALALTVGVLWTVTLINAHNMVDGMDGLAASIGTVESLTLACMLALQTNVPAASLALSLAAVCGAFYRYNRHPAQLFMGDTGSQLIGLALGVLSLRLDLGAMGSLGCLVPLLVVALPLSDLGFAVVRRLSRGESPFAADRGHWHHRLYDAGYGQRGVCRWLSLFSLLLGGVGILLCREAWYPFAVYLTLTAVGAVVLLDTVGRHSKQKGG
ncbi:MAG: undecaprenyl/decaprenyl-phosphate alpha-N-acetylglucosaminyl 1-phosphate transferase [Clostridia bacterium]|nr:undecaprenyl/decaprenyl-phosphate alpha-N-acetylglucosaminyl 1-phosphate transferase [Clostridia bacterium]